MHVSSPYLCLSEWEPREKLQFWCEGFGCLEFLRDTSSQQLPEAWPSFLQYPSGTWRCFQKPPLRSSRDVTEGGLPYEFPAQPPVKIKLKKKVTSSIFSPQNFDLIKTVLSCLSYLFQREKYGKLSFLDKWNSIVSVDVVKKWKLQYILPKLRVWYNDWVGKIVTVSRNDFLLNNFAEGWCRHLMVE